ncbi:MAG: primosomal protein N' [Ignavibacteria bacterium]|nr:primosomal protein N' [Ignavibacteria bacterium]
MVKKLVNVVFDLPVDSVFTYSVPENLADRISPGMRVLAPLGRRTLTGLIVEIPSESQLQKIKSIITILDPDPVLKEEMLRFCKWISDYYMSPIGETMFSALPKDIKMESKIHYFIKQVPGDSEPEHMEIIRMLSESGPLTLRQIERKSGADNARSVIQSLIRRGIVSSELITKQKKLKPKYENYVTFTLREDFEGFNEKMIDNFCGENGIKSENQIRILKYLVKKNIQSISQKELLKTTSCGLNSLKSLARKEYLKIIKKPVIRSPETEFSEESPVSELNSDQKTVLHKIFSSYTEGHTTFLLFGVTGSGKTQVYIEAIRKIISENKTALMLVPEISLTPQLIHRFRVNFGDIVGVIHSRISEGERFDVYRRISNKEIKIVIGARSALFAPIENLGIIVVDEEHDSSYKQTEKNPRYNARDSAVLRAKLNNALCILGSATPSLESFYNCVTGKYRLLELPHRALKTKQPQVEIVNMLEEMRQPSKYMKRETPESRFLSSRLISLINQALEKKQSIILLQNRRGYSAYQQCMSCGYVKMCDHCDITMIYHKIKNHLRCHYCGSTSGLLEKCEQCGNSPMILKGTGTEKVEEEISRLFPKSRIRRMDADTVKGKDSYRKILKNFHEGKYDILIGTQMISKGLDIPNVSLVGVISADIGLFNPDFRSSEKTFQLLAQVAGRSGRKSDFGKVIIQTMNPENIIFTFIKNHDYISFYQNEINHRKEFRYPPFSRMTLIEIKSPDEKRALNIAYSISRNINEICRNFDHIEIMKPSPALIYKLKNKYRIHIIIKNPKISSDKPSVQKILRKALGELNLKSSVMKLKSTEQINIDVDPVNFY